MVRSDAHRNKYTETVKVLIQFGSSPNDINLFHKNPLMTACEIEEINIVKLLLEYIRFKDVENSTPSRKENFSVNTECPTLWSETRKIMHTGSTPLIKAVEKENISLVKLLLGAKVPVDERDGGKATALYYAA